MVAQQQLDLLSGEIAPPRSSTRRQRIAKSILHRAKEREKERREPESNRRIGLLQSPALPLGYPAISSGAVGATKRSCIRYTRLGFWTTLFFSLGDISTVARSKGAVLVIDPAKHAKGFQVFEPRDLARG